ncbi:unnamed protein product [Vicia faba]|uniref:Uncharacterized protein n=1 Tax=Vicia faba TaxID=3906 RepID=A0AAV1AVP9_VICFA|nr:unnamed protein product [Vicia faba]
MEDEGCDVERMQCRGERVFFSEFFLVILPKNLENESEGPFVVDFECMFGLEHVWIGVYAGRYCLSLLVMNESFRQGIENVGNMKICQD